jgi:hypothetical protein
MRCRDRRPPFLLLGCFTLTLALGAPAPCAAQPETWQAAATWLALVDNARYADAWTEASRIFQRAATREAWARRAAAIWDQGGDATSRELIDTHEVIDPPDLPAGTYRQLRFECQCSKAGLIRETVVMVEEPGRGWRVASYTAVPRGR